MGGGGIHCREPTGKSLDDQGRCKDSVHAAISLLVTISNAMHNGDKLLQIINAASLPEPDPNLENSTTASNQTFKLLL